MPFYDCSADGTPFLSLSCFLKLLGLIIGYHVVDELIYIALQNTFQFVKRQADPGRPILQKGEEVVGEEEEEEKVGEEEEEEKEEEEVEEEIECGQV